MGVVHAVVVDSPPQRPYVGAIARYGASERVESYIRDDARRAVNRVPPEVLERARDDPAGTIAEILGGWPLERPGGQLEGYMTRPVLEAARASAQRRGDPGPCEWSELLSAMGDPTRPLTSRGTNDHTGAVNAG